MLAAIRHNVILAIAAGMFVSSGAILSADEADDRYTVAAAHYDQGRWQPAAEEFQAFLQKYPQDSRRNQCLYYLGETLLKLGKYEDAGARFKECVESEPAGKFARAALFRLGEAAYLTGKFDLAKADLNRFLTKYPQDKLNAFALPYLGEMALAEGDAPAAAKLFQDALKRYPDGESQDSCRVGLARALETQNQIPEAERLYRSVAAKAESPLADAAQFHLGALYYAAGKNEQAIECFAVFDDRLVKSPWRPNARLGYGLVLLKLDRADEAGKLFDAVLADKSAGDELYQRAMRGKVQAALQTKDHAAVDRLAADFEKRFPKSQILAGVRRMAARSLVERKSYDRAVALIETLLAADGGGTPDLESRYLLAVAYEGLNRNEEALSALLPVVDAAAGPLKAEAQLAQGSLLLALKKYAEAIPPLEAYLAGKPDGDAEAKALGELAICSARAGKLDKAKQLFAKLTEKHPRSPLMAPTIERLSEAAYDADDAAWAGELSKRLAALGGSPEYDLKGKLGLGWSQYKSGKQAEAAETLDAVVKNEKNPSPEITAEAAFVRGRILEDLGREQPALEMYELVIKSHPTSKQHRDALSAAAQLCQKMNQSRQAAVYYERLVKDYPQSPKLDSALYEWAWALLSLGETEPAGRLFLRLHDELPKSRFWADATCRAARLAFEKKDFNRASELIETALKTDADPHSREFALDLRGEIAAARADWPKAREAYETLLKDFPDSKLRTLIEFKIAESFYNQRDYDTAAAKLDLLAERLEKGRVEPWTAVVPLRRAQIYALQNKWDEAHDVAATIEGRFPDFPQQYEVDYLLGRCLANRADFEAARRAYQKVIHSTTGEKTETAAMAQWMIGETYFHQKNYPAAVKEYLNLKSLYAFPTWQAAALLQAGKCNELLGEPKQAADLYRQVLKDYSQTVFAEQARGRMDGLRKINDR